MSPISVEEAQALRARVAELKAKHPERIGPLARALGPSSFYTFMKGARRLARVNAERLDQMLKESAALVKPDDEPRARGPGQRGRIHQYLPEAEAAELRDLAEAHIKTKLGGINNRLAEAMGVGWSYLRKPIKGKQRFTLQLAARLRAAIAGHPAPAKPPHAKHGPKPKSMLVAHDRAPRNVLANLRLDAGHVLSSRFDGSVAALARAIGMTAHRLTKFLDGGPLTLDESADMVNRLSTLGPSEAASPAPGVTMLRAVDGISIEAWRKGGVGAAGEMDPPELRARKLVEKWGAEAIVLILQLSGGGAA